MLLLEALGENPSLPFPRDSGGCWKFVAFLPCTYVTPVPASISPSLSSSLCLHMTFLLRKGSLDQGLTLIQL